MVAEDSNEPGQEGGVRYLSVDALGSTRLVTKGDGSVGQRVDYWPFGEEIIATTLAGNRNLVSSYGGTSQVKQKFTGKERDAETGLDYFGARYFSGAQGRFTSPDAPFADQLPEDPQSWNMYAYVRNNPLKNTDPNGRDCFQGAVSCANYLLGGAGTVANAMSSGIINAPNRIADSVVGLFNGGQRVFGDLVPDAFTPTNVDQQQGMEAANAVMLVAPLAEAGATALVNAVGRGARVEADTAAAVQETGTVYKLPAQEGIRRACRGSGQANGHQAGWSDRTRRTDRYLQRARSHGQYKEQKAINAQGGLKNLDNKRNEVNPKRYEELKKKYENQP